MRAGGRLPCRASGQTLTALELSLDIPSAGARITGPRLLALDPALARQPDFVRALVHEAALLDPVNRDIAAGVWLAGLDPAERTQARADAASRAFADATELWWSAADPSALPSRVPATVFGTLPVPFAVNPWRDPWLPLFAEFDYSFTPHDASNTAALALDPLEPRFTSPSPGAPLSGSDRQALSSAPPATLQSAIARVQDHFGKVPANQAALDELVVRLASLDMLTVGFGALDPQLRAAGHALRGGALGLPRLRLVDTFGRTRPPEVVPPRLLPPRLTHWARVQTRLVDAQARDAGPLRSPLAGVLVFDAVEQALEIFTATGAPLGQLRHDRGTHLAAWEPAPGRDGVPLGQLPATLAELAAAMLAPPAPSTSESAVAAVLKVLDRARIGVARRLTSDDAVALPVQLPVPLRPESGGLTISANTSLLGGVAEAAGELIEYPYGCVEQTASRLVPLVALSELSRTHASKRMLAALKLGATRVTGVDIEQWQPLLSWLQEHGFSARAAEDALLAQWGTPSRLAGSNVRVLPTAKPPQSPAVSANRPALAAATGFARFVPRFLRPRA
mgnify:CR=1 FL=1